MVFLISSFGITTKGYVVMTMIGIMMIIIIFEQ